MDDFDHSIHIAESDWSSFYDESEGCDLLQPSLAYPDDSGLSDSEDSGNNNLVYSTGQQETQRRTDANSGGGECTSAEKSSRSCIKSPEHLNQSGAGGSEDDAARSTKRMEICVGCPGRNTITTVIAQETTEETMDSRTNTLQTLNSFSSGETKKTRNDGDAQTVNNRDSTEESGLFSLRQTELSVNESDATERPVADVRAEKERWFVTVNDNLARRRRRSSSVKKKRRQNKACERRGHTGIVLSRGVGSVEKGADVNVINHKCEEGTDVQSHQNKKSQTSPSDEVKADVYHMSGDLSDKSMEQETYELEDSVGFVSLHMYDSESCLSAAESVEETQHPLQENPQLQDSLSLTENTKADRTEDGQMSPQFVAAANCKRFKTINSNPSLMFPLCQRPAETPDDDSTCENNSHAETSGAQMEDYLSFLPAPDFSLTPCSAASSPETYAKAAGDTKPVYAISAFWDEMEKLTIKDILQVRKSRCSPPKPIQETVVPDPTSHSLQVEPMVYNMSDSGLVDTSDAADSDYFTQPDESKPDTCSQDFLASDFEEEYWHFVSASRNPSPEFHCRNQQGGPSSLTYEESSTSSEGRGTPVPLDDFLGHCFNNQTSESLSRSRNPHLGGNSDLNPHSTLETLVSASLLSELKDTHHQISFPEIIECFFTESETNMESQTITVYDPEKIPVSPEFKLSYYTLREDTLSSLQSSLDRPIPIFSCSHPTVRELTFPKQLNVFLREGEGKISPVSSVRVISHMLIQANPHTSSSTAADVSGFHCWDSLGSMRRISFPDKGSIRCRSSGVWMFPCESDDVQIRKDNPTVMMLGEGKVNPGSSQVFTGLEETREVLETIRTTKQEGIFSSVKQSDMCLVCIAFASWVLRSTDPEAADTWKAALLANVSALSAIQYLRQHMKKKKNPPPDEF